MGRVCRMLPVQQQLRKGHVRSALRSVQVPVFEQTSWNMSGHFPWALSVPQSGRSRELRRLHAGDATTTAPSPEIITRAERVPRSHPLTVSGCSRTCPPSRRSGDRVRTLGRSSACLHWRPVYLSTLTSLSALCKRR